MAKWDKDNILWFMHIFILEQILDVHVNIFHVGFLPLCLHKPLVLTHSMLQLVERHRVNFTKRKLFSNANICRMKHKYSKGKIQSSLIWWFEKSLFYFRTEWIFLSGRTIYLQQTKDLSLSHAKHYANKNELVFPTPRWRQIMLISFSNITQERRKLKALDQV